MSCPSHDDAKWDAYPNTILEFHDAASTRIDLRRPLGDVDRERLKALGLARPFAVFTAENPCGENVEDEPTEREAERLAARNARRLSRLETDLNERGAPFVLVDGVAPDGSYRERCVAVLTSRADATRTAERFEQLALFWYDGRDFWLLAARLDEPPRRLP